MTTLVSLDGRTSDPTLLRADEVANLLRVTPRTVRRWGAAGVLEQIRLGDRLTRYTLESVEALIHPSTSESAATTGGGSG